jgi:septum formation protein
MAPKGVSSRPRLVLASGSPRRRELLGALGVEAEQLAVDIDETPLDGETPVDLVRRLAEAKATAALTRCGSQERTVVIAADTVVVLDDEIFGKPRCAAEARTMLSRLSGRTHHVHTGVTVAADDRLLTAVDDTLVRFRELDATDIDCYVATGEPLDKAGAYGIQGRGGLFVDRIEGTYHNVVGLPIALVDELCTSMGWSLSTWWGGV